MKSAILSVFAVILIAGVSCNGQQNQENQQNKSESVVASADSQVEVIYFHTTSRCMTCKTVEAEAKSNVALLYSTQVIDGKISFASYNIEEPDGKAVAERVGVEGQSLMIVKGEQKINLINDGFMYAVKQPEKFREIMKEKIDPLLK